MLDVAVLVRELTFFCHFVRILDKAEVKAVESSLYVDALVARIVVIIHKHEVRVDFKAATFAQN